MVLVKSYKYMARWVYFTLRSFFSLFNSFDCFMWLPIGENLGQSFAHLLGSDIFMGGYSWKSTTPRIYLKGKSAFVVGEIEDKCISLFASLFNGLELHS